MIRLIASIPLFVLALGAVGCTSPQPQTPDDEIVDLVESAGAVDSTSDEVGSLGDKPSNDSGEDRLEDEITGSEQGQSPEESKVAESPEPIQDEFSEEPQQTQPDQLQEQVPQEEMVEQAPPPDVPPQPVTESEPSAPSLVEIKDIKYLANRNGGTIVIDSEEPLSYSVRPKPDTHQFVIEIDNALLPARLKRPFLMKEFGTSFAALNAYQNPGSSVVRVVVQMKGDRYGEPVVQQEGASIVVVPAPPLAESIAQAEAPAQSGPAVTELDSDSAQIDVARADADEKALGARSLDEFLAGTSRFYGRPISIEVTDNDIREVLKFISEESGLNMVINEDVAGKITIKLRRIPWDQALITIMKAKNLGYVRQGNVVRIATLASLQAENEAAKKILDSQKTVAPLRVKVIPVSYSRVEDLSTQVKGFLGPRGQVAIDVRTSSLILTDTEDVLEKVHRLVRELDIPPAQVMIEGKVVEANDSFSKSVGLNWGFRGGSKKVGSGPNGDILFRPDLAITNLPVNTVGLNTVPFGANIRVGTLDLFGDINAFLSLAETESMVKILSSPRVITLNKEKAHIEQRGEVISRATVQNQNVTTVTPVRDQFSLNLDVTPQITADGSVIMDVNVKRQFPGAVEEVSTQARPINTRLANTKVLVKDGQTAVIGGIYSSDETNQENGVPWLREIPVLGWLFKSKIRSAQRNELLIFLTPKILNIKDQAAEG